ncbi:MAG TPA: PAC2 family protein [Candidatus Nanoarchaeia archaeon]|nr:PAC2 family protein [Candidatus Nanoarchaeia archaeon]
MKHELNMKPKSPIIVVGFPGYGLIGTIVTEFLIKHLDAKPIGRIVVREVHPIVAIHDRKVVDPIGIFYDKKYNMLIVHALASINGLEWRLADEMTHIFKELKAKEIISIEGVGNPTLVKDGQTFYFSDNDKKFQSIGMTELKEGIIMGVTGALLLKKGIKLSCIFAETHSQLPDSRGAAKVVEVLDKYLGLKVDYKPLLKEAELFETKLKELMEKSQALIPKQKDENKQVYIG